MNLEVIGAEEVASRLTMIDAIDALQSFFAEPGATEAPQRSHFQPRTGTDLLLMPAWDGEVAGVKLITVDRARSPFVDGVYCFFDAELRPRAVIDAAALTAIRTAAVSGVATRLLARDGCKTLVVFGNGTQARAHIEAMRAVRPIEDVIVVSRGDPSDVVSGADIVCTCTTSSTPVFDGRLLRDGTHINAIGAYKPDQRELDDATMSRGKIFVEERSAAGAEAGDLLLAQPPPRISADLFEVAANGFDRSAGDVTVFKSVGVAYEDLVVARALIS